MTERICEKDQLWVPGLSLENEYPVPTNDELVKAWSEYSGKRAIETTNVFGVYTPIGSVAAMASIDLCEVVRESAFCVDNTYGIPPKRRSHYKDGTWVEHVHTELEKSTTTPIVQVAMNAGLVEPDENIEEISESIRRWRQAGVYVVANTSTLPGCELATIEKFMSKWMVGCFDALVLPRNHDGTGSISKADAIGYLASDIGLDIHSIPIVKIDDATHHIESFLSNYGEHEKAAYFIPKHIGNKDKLHRFHTETSIEAFQKATKFFRNEGVNV